MNNNRSFKRTRVNRASSQRPNSRKRGSAQPLQIESNIRLAHTYRFNSTSSFSGAITPSQIFGALGAMGTVTNATVTSLVGSFKINHLELWAPPASQGAAATVSVDWQGFNNSPNREYSDTTVSVTTPAHVRCKPPPSSLAAFWQHESSTAIFNLMVPSGTVIDLGVSWILTDDDIGGNATIVVATAVVGTVYFLPLDHPVAGGTGVLIPVSLTTTQ